MRKQQRLKDPQEKTTVPEKKRYAPRDGSGPITCLGRSSKACDSNPLAFDPIGSEGHRTLNAASFVDLVLRRRGW